MELAFDSTLGFPGEGPEKSGSIFDFFRRQDSGSAATSGTGTPMECCAHGPTQEPLPIDPQGLHMCDLLVAYAEEVLYNNHVSGRGVYEQPPDKQGRYLILCPMHSLIA